MKHLYFLEVGNSEKLDTQYLNAVIAAALIDATRDAPISIKLELGGTYDESNNPV